MSILKRSEIILKGNVQMVGFRTFIKNAANSLNIKGFADNLEDGSVVIVCEGREENIKELIILIEENHPHFVRIDSVAVSYDEYKGEFMTFERKGKDVIEDVPKDATINDLFRVMTRFDGKGEILIGILNSINNTQDQMLEILNSINNKQDQMLEKQNEIISTIRNESELTRKEIGGKVDLFNVDYRDHAELNYRDIKEETKDIKKDIRDIKEEITNIKISSKK